jgi:PKD repeat protein
MTYDTLNRLWTFNGSWGSGSFAYLANGDRSTKTVASVNTNYAYSTNRLTSTTGGEAASFAYNGSGDLTSLNSVSLTIDMLHNVTSYNGTSVVSFAYDGDGMRVTKSSSGNTVVYHYDKEGRLLSEDGGNGVLIADYIYLNGKLAAKVVNTFTVTASVGAHGSLDASTPSPQTANYNGTSTFIFNADTGYHVTGVSGCGGTSYANTDNAVSTYTYTTGPITADCTVTATFAIDQYTVTLSPGTGGNFSPSTLPLINYNATTSSTANPNSGYHIMSISGCGGVSVGPQSTNASYLYTTGQITSDCTVTATFSNTYTVSASAGANGSLDTSYRTSPQIVTYNGTTSFKFNASTGYHVASVSGCGGTPYTNTSNIVSSYTYTTGAITSNCTVAAAFAINQYQVAASTGANGNLDAAYTSPQTINYGGTTSFKFNAATGYHVANVSGCFGTTYNNAANTVSSFTYTTGPITADCAVTASFAINQYTVTATAGANGNMDASYRTSPQTVNYNGTTSFKFDAAIDYHVASISGCGGTDYNNTLPAVTSYTYSTGLITEDCTVTASFVINPPIASFVVLSAKPSSGKVPLQVSFGDTSAPAATSWDWDFGDGSHSTEQNPVHVFETYGSGSYTVTLTATNEGGSSAPVTQSVTVLACDNPQRVKLSNSVNQYNSISAAYADAAEGDTIQSQAIHFTENLIVNKNIIFDGGYDCDILEKIGNTTVKGITDPTISIETGSATMDEIAIE